MVPLKSLILAYFVLTLPSPTLARTLNIIPENFTLVPYMVGVRMPVFYRGDIRHPVTSHNFVDGKFRLYIILDAVENLYVAEKLPYSIQSQKNLKIYIHKRSNILYNQGGNFDISVIKTFESKLGLYAFCYNPDWALTIKEVKEALEVCQSMTLKVSKQ